MLAVEPRKRRKAPVGIPEPRLAPPRPLRSSFLLLAQEAACMGIAFMPWQDRAGLYLYATKAGGWLYPEVPIVVGRQNGKTEILKPLICQRLRAGRRLMHTAQNRELPREVFGQVAEHMIAKHRGELAAKPRFANGQEEIRLRNGGRYRIVAPTRGGARGPSNDDLLIDEIRELVDHDFIAAAKPTLSASPNPQTVYLSNAGTSESAVLNALKRRGAEGDPSLAYLEWSAPPGLAADDVAGWLWSNPAIGHLPGKYENVEREYRANLLGRTMEVFEVEYLCRWQTSLDERLVRPEDWADQDFGPLGRPLRAYMAVKMDPLGARVSAVIAWAEGEHVCLDVHDTTGSPIDVSLLGPDLLALANANRAAVTAFDPYTDADLARYLRKPKPINGREYAAASEKFVRLVAERRLRVNDPGGVLAKDLEWTTRKPAPYGSFMAVQASDEYTNTAAIAAVRAAWLASAPVSTAPARIH